MRHYNICVSIYLYTTCIPLLQAEMDESFGWEHAWQSPAGKYGLHLLIWYIRGRGCLQAREALLSLFSLVEGEASYTHAHIELLTGWLSRSPSRSAQRCGVTATAAGEYIITCGINIADILRVMDAKL